MFQKMLQVGGGGGSKNILALIPISSQNTSNMKYNVEGGSSKVYMAFDNSDGLYWVGSVTNSYIGYEFDKKKVANAFKIRTIYAGSPSPTVRLKNFKIYGTNESVFNTSTASLIASSVMPTTLESNIILESSVEYKAYYLLCEDSYGGAICISKFQVYGIE